MVYEQNHYTRKIMEIMQILAAVRLDSPEIWANVDKYKVKLISESAKRNLIGSQEYNDMQHYEISNNAAP